MKNKYILIFSIFFILLGCSKEIERKPVPHKDTEIVDDGIFVQLQFYSASAGTYLDHFPKYMTVNNNGEINVFTKEMTKKDASFEMEIGDDPPTIEKEISNEEVNEIKQVIKRNRFFSLPKNVTDYDVMDGDGSTITVLTIDGEAQVGGENSSNEEYNEIERVIFSHIREEYDEWVEETEAYLEAINE